MCNDFSSTNAVLCFSYILFKQKLESRTDLENFLTLLLGTWDLRKVCGHPYLDFSLQCMLKCWDKLNTDNCPVAISQVAMKAWERDGVTKLFISFSYQKRALATGSTWATAGFMGLHNIWSQAGWQKDISQATLPLWTRCSVPVWFIPV